MNIQADLPPALPEGRWALFLDIDGTLLEHAAHPDSVSVSDELRQLLETIERRLDGALAFITGRSISAVDHLFDPLKLRIAGLYGLEHRLLPGGRIEAADEPADMSALADEIELELASKAVYVERGTMAGGSSMRLAEKTDDKAPYFAIVLVAGWSGKPGATS